MQVSHFISFLLLYAFEAKASSTYNLYFDGILLPDAGNRLAGQEVDANGSDCATLPPTFLTELSTNFMNDIIHFYNTVQLNMTSESTEELSGSAECLVAQDDILCRTTAVRGSCVAQHLSESDDMEVNVLIRLQKSKEGTTLRCEVMMTAPTTDLARETLIRMVPRASLKLRSSTNDMVWSIQHQPSFTEAKESFLGGEDSVIADQERKDCRAASIDELILGNAWMKNRTRLDHASSTSHLLDVWSYEDVKFLTPVKSLFVDGYLAATTSPSGVAHAEALVHPAMIAHPSPTRALIISLTPNAIVKEVLKYKSINHVSVVGLDDVATNLIEKHMPDQCECGFMGPKEPSNCMQCTAVKVVKESLNSWLFNQEESFDVVFVDVPIGNHEWLSTDMYDRLLGKLMSEEEAIIVVSSGSMPSLFEVDTETILSPRESLIRHVSRESKFGGLDASTLLYDEPLAQPLSSTYIIIFPQDAGSSYYRFVRRNAPAIDVDLVNRLRPNISDRGHPTMVYDGPTHLNYLMISRAWEHWYCQTIPGRNLPVCADFLPKWFNQSYHFSNAEVKRDPKKGRSLVTREDIPKGHFVLPDDAALGIRIERDKWEALNQFVEDFPDATMFRDFRDFVIAYGFESESLERSGWVVSIASKNSFTNHACTKEEETTTTIRDIHFTEDGGDDVEFSPPVNRRADLFGVLTMTSRDVKAGEELAMDYSCFRENPDEEFKEFLREICEEENGGLVHDTVIE